MTPQKARRVKGICIVCPWRINKIINHRKDITTIKQNNEKTSKGVALTEAQWERCDRLANEMGCRSRNAFIRDAIDFYCSWLEKEQSERFLTPALESVISAKIRDSEERINRNLFKIAVDLSILAKIVLDEDGGGYDEDYLAEIRRDSIREVSETNGAIRMEQRFK